MSSSTTSVTEWLQQLKQGESQATQKLWQRYIERLVRLARKHLRTTPRRMADEEDVALAAFASFCAAAESGRFPRLEDRDDLWQVLLVLTERKAIDQMRRAYAEKRGGGDVRGESVFEKAGDSDSPAVGLGGAPDQEITPEAAALAAEQFRLLLDSLEDEQLRRIAVAKMEGYGNEEIADSMGTSLRTIERRLAMIRQTWEETLRDESE